MWYFKRTSLPVLLILLGVFACAVPEFPQAGQTFDGTSIAETVAAIIQQTQTAATPLAAVPSDTLAPGVTPSATFTPVPPSFTPTATSSPLPIFTVTPIFPMISVSVPTNCRVGPGKAYEMVGALLVGETVQVYAQAPGGNYWYIHNPDSPTEFCWVWGEYANLTGYFSSLPVFTPPPTPTATLTSTPSPAFEADYSGLDSCSGWWADIRLKNTGSITFRSISMTLKDTVTSTVVASIDDGFTDNTGCSSNSRNALLPGKNATESSPQFSYDPTGHKLKANITLCSSTGLNGTCITESITFTP